MKKISLIILLFFIFPIIASASINLTIQSENERVVKIININDFSNNSITNNQTKQLSYENYILNIYPENTKIINNNGSFIINNLQSISNDRYRFIWIGIIFSLIVLSYLIIRKIG